MSSRASLHILPLRDEYTFCFSNFLIIGLCDSSAKLRLAKSERRCFSKILLLSAPSEDVLQKKIINQWNKYSLISILVWIFSISNNLSRNNLSEAVLLVKFLKSPSAISWEDITNSKLYDKLPFRIFNSN